jgi:hypothetical protein
MTEAAFLLKWETRVVEYQQLRVSADAASLCKALLNDLAQVRATREDRIVCLSEAAAASGYSQTHLARLVKDGKLKSLRPPGGGGRLTFRIADLPKKPAAPHTTAAGVHDLASRLFRGKEGRDGQS